MAESKASFGVLAMVVGLTAVAVLFGAGHGCTSKPPAPPPPVAEKVKDVINLEFEEPTGYKAQCKLWYAHERWWVWLPNDTKDVGSEIWSRKKKKEEWDRAKGTRKALLGLPPRADVWADQDSLRAVLCGDRELAVVGMKYDPQEQTYVVDGTPYRWPSSAAAGDAEWTELATIARDSTGRWWVAYDDGPNMVVRVSSDATAKEFGPPVPVNTRPAKADDVCAIVAMHGAVGVFWSDQEHDAMQFRRHLDNKPPDQWEPVEIVAEKTLCADDHVNLKAAVDGTVYVATKNSVDSVGRPQFCLYVRRPDGTWETHPYAPRTETETPTRPVVLLAGSPERLYVCHTIGPRKGAKDEGLHDFPGTIVVYDCDPSKIDLNRVPDQSYRAKRSLNDITTCRNPLPPNAPWFIMASENKGRVYELELPSPNSTTAAP